MRSGTSRYLCCVRVAPVHPNRIVGVRHGTRQACALSETVQPWFRRRKSTWRKAEVSSSPLSEVIPLSLRLFADRFWTQVPSRLVLWLLFHSLVCSQPAAAEQAIIGAHTRRIRLTLVTDWVDSYCYSLTLNSNSQPSISSLALSLVTRPSVL